MTKVRATTAVNDGWKQPKKRKPMTEAQKKIASENLAKARAAKAPAKNESIHPTVLEKGDDYYLSAKNVKSWIKTQKEIMSSLRFEVRKEVKGAKAKYHSAQGYIRQMRHYLKHGDGCTDFYGPYEEKRIKWVTITPKG